MALDTVQKFVDQARVLLQDQNVPYRYPDADLVAALAMAMLEVRRLRPELLLSYFSTTLPDFSTSSMSASVPIDPMYRMALLYFICGLAQLRDDESTQDSRATIFMNKFIAQLLTISA